MKYYDPYKLQNIRDRMEKVLETRNCFELDGERYVRIPQAEGRIRRLEGENDTTAIAFVDKKRQENGQGNEKKNEQENGQENEKENGEETEEEIVIGSLPSEFPGVMCPNENYDRFFDCTTGQLKEPFRTEEKKVTKEEPTQTAKPSQGKRKEKKQPAGETNPREEALQEKENALQAKETKLQEKEEELRKKETELQAREDKLAGQKEKYRQIYAQLEEYRKQVEQIRIARLVSLKERDDSHFGILYDILQSYETTIQEQAKRRPDTLMRLTQIRTVNQLLTELKSFFLHSDIADYLHLAEEPYEDDLEHHPGTTYGEMTLLLSAYQHACGAYRSERLYLRSEEYLDAYWEQEQQRIRENQKDETDDP